jgi:hypothetical protein
VAEKSGWRNPFSFLFAGRRSEKQIAVYIVREHKRGRGLDDILNDPYVRNRCSEREIARVLETPEVIRALGDDIVAEQIKRVEESPRA